MFDEQNSGWNSQITGPSETPEEAWRYTTEANVDVPVSFANETLYFGEWSNQLYALNGVTGEEEWRQPVGGSIQYSAPAISEGSVVIGTFSGDVFCLDAQEGGIRWEFEEVESISASPTISNGVVYIVDGSATLYALSIDDGSEIWSFETQENTASVSAPAVTDTVVIFSATEFASEPPSDLGYLYSTESVQTLLQRDAKGVIHAINLETGEKRWTYSIDHTIASSPSAGETLTYVGGFDNQVHAVSVENGSQEWSFSTDDVVFSTPAVTPERVYVTSTDGSLYALDHESGDQQWFYPTGGRLVTSPVVANNLIYFINRDQRIFAVDEGGTKIWDLGIDAIAHGTPAVVEQAMFVPTKGQSRNNGEDPGRILALVESE